MQIQHTIRDLKTPVTGKDVSISDAIQALVEGGRGAVIFLENERPFGILTERDLLFFYRGDFDLSSPILPYIKQPLITVSMDRSVEFALHLMLDNGIRRLVVTDPAGKIFGLVNQDDLFLVLKEAFYHARLRATHIIGGRREIHFVDANLSFVEAVSTMWEKKIGMLPVYENGVPVGIVTETDVLRSFSDPSKKHKPVREIMSAPIFTVPADMYAVDLLNYMEEKQIRHACVASQDGKEIIGTITHRDLLRNLEGGYVAFLENKVRMGRDALNNLAHPLIEFEKGLEGYEILWTNKKALECFQSQLNSNYLNGECTEIFRKIDHQFKNDSIKNIQTSCRIGGLSYSVTVTKLSPTIFQTLWTDITNIETLNRESERRLREKEEREKELDFFRRIMDKISDSMFVVDPSTKRFVDSNRRAYETLGYTREELLQLTVDDIRESDGSDASWNDWGDHMGTLQREGKDITYAYHKKKDGSKVRTEASVSLLKIGNKDFVVALVRYISGRLELEEQISLINRRYKDLVRSLPVGMFRNTIHDRGRFIDANPALADILEAESTALLMEVSPADLYENSNERNLVLQELRSEGFIQDRRIIMKTLRGRRIYVSMSAILRLDEGEWIIEGVLEDETDKVEAQNKLAESEQRYRQLFEGNQAIEILLDPETGNIVDANRSAALFYGYSVAELKKKNISEINNLSKEEVALEMERARNEKRHHFFFKHRLADGSLRDVEVHSGPVNLEGKDLLYSIVHDVTDRKKAEREVEEKQKSIQTILDSQPNIIIVTGGDSLYSANAAFFHFSGFADLDSFKKNHECICDYFLNEEGYIASDRGEWIQTIKNNRAAGQESKVKMYDRVKAEDRVFLVRIGDLPGEQEQYIVTFTDITDLERIQRMIVNSNRELEDMVRKRTWDLVETNNRLQESEESLKLAQRIAHLGNWEMELSSGRIHWSEEIFRILRYEGTALEPEAFVDRFVFSEDRAELKTMLRQILDDPAEAQQDVRIQRVDGETRYLSIQVRVYRDDNEKPIRMYGTVQDITDRVQLKQKQEISEERYRNLFNSASEAIYIHGFNGNHPAKFTEVNDRTCSLLGYTRDEFLQLSLLDVILETESEVEELMEALLHTRYREWEVNLVERSGEIIRVSIVSVVLILEGEPTAYNSVRDIREKIKQEQESKERENLLVQQSKMAAMGEMIGLIAHQWRQPLNGIGLVVQDLEDAYQYGELTETYMSESVKQVYGQLSSMSQTIDDFRNFFKPSREEVHFFVMDALDQVFRMVGEQLRNHGIAFELKNNTETDPKIYGFPNEFKHAFINLINNSRDAILARRKKENSSSIGKITIAVNATDEEVRLDCADDGGGIPVNFHSRVFNPYFTTKGSEGTGIGLYMTNMIIKKMDGNITFRNEEDGAVFSIALPVSEGTSSGSQP